MKEKHGKLLQWLCLGAGIILIVGIMLFNFLTKMKREGAAYYADQMSAIAENHALKLNNEIELIRVAGKTAADMLSDNKEIDNDDIKAAADAVLKATGAYRVVYHRGNGAGIGYDGNELTKMDLTKCTYYRLIYRAADVRYVHVESDEFNGEEALMLVIPLKTRVDRNLLIYYPMEKVNSLLRVSTEFDSNSFAALVGNDGTIITKNGYVSSFLAGDNFWANIDSDYEQNITKAKVQIMNRMQGSFFAGAGGEEKTLVYAPVKANEWVVMVGVDQSYVQKKERNYWKTSATMMWQLLTVLLLFFGVYLTITIVSKKKSEENDRLLREKADTDLLTGLTNKLATERKIKEYIEQYPDALAMMFVLDIDNFKKINDTMGHAFGDEVLKTLGRTIGSLFRVSDIIGRTGGDEFTIFLKFLKTDENTLKEAQKLVYFFKDFTAGEYVKYSATASIGAAVFPTHGKDFETLYKAADKALYKAKQRGKNQLAFYDDRDRADKEDITEKGQS